MKYKISIKEYYRDVWYNKYTIINIIFLQNLIKQYRVTYDSDDERFVIHRQIENKINLYFKIYTNGLYYFDPRDKNFQESEKNCFYWDSDQKFRKIHKMITETNTTHTRFVLHVVLFIYL